MGWFDWMWDALRYLGLSSKQGKILFLGLDNAGKTTLLGKMKEGKLGSHRPTKHPNHEEFAIGSIRLRAFDLGGHAQGRLLWKRYFTKVDGVVYLVDVADHDRIGLVKSELDNLLKEEMLSKVPFVILGNKVDLPGALSEAQFKSALGIDGMTTGKEPKETRNCNYRPMEVFMTSIVMGRGYGEAFRWLAKYLEDA